MHNHVLALEPFVDELLQQHGYFLDQAFFFRPVHVVAPRAVHRENPDDATLLHDVQVTCPDFPENIGLLQ